MAASSFYRDPSAVVLDVGGLIALQLALAAALSAGLAWLRPALEQAVSPKTFNAVWAAAAMASIYGMYGVCSEAWARRRWAFLLPFVGVGVMLLWFGRGHDPVTGLGPQWDQFFGIFAGLTVLFSGMALFAVFMGWLAAQGDSAESQLE